MLGLVRRVATKIKGDFRGAIRLACSDDTLADFNDDTFNVLQAKHLPPHSGGEALFLWCLPGGSGKEEWGSVPHCSGLHPKVKTR